MLDGFPAACAVRTPDDVAALVRDLRDPIVVLGASIPGLVLAALLSRTRPVVLVPGPPPVRKRLVNGCSTRRATLAILERCFGGVERTGGQFSRLVITGEAVGRPWFDARAAAPIGRSTRHGAILDDLRARLPERVRVIGGEVPIDASYSADGVPVRIGGEIVSVPASAVLNATPLPLLRPTWRPPVAQRQVVVVQTPMRVVGPLPYGDDAAITPYVGGSLRRLAFFTPFVDADTPEATWYGIDTAVVPTARIAAEKEALLASVGDTLDRLAHDLGLEPIDGGARATAVVPVGDPTPPDDGVPVIDVHRAFTSGAPAINVDGMLAGAAGAEAFADAWGSDASGAAEAVLRPIRKRNRDNEWLFFESPRVAPGVLSRLLGPVRDRVLADWADLGAR